MTIITKALSAIGLMRVSEHDREMRELWEEAARGLAEFREGQTDAYRQLNDKFKKAVADLEGKVRENEELKADRDEWESAALNRDKLVFALQIENDSLRPDALLWRNARDKRAKNRGDGK